MRYFKVDPQTYEQSRLYLDSLFGHPNGRADTCLPPEPPTTEDGKALVAIPESMTEWPEVAPLIESLLSGGVAIEITQDQYSSHIPDSIM